MWFRLLVRGGGAVGCGVWWRVLASSGVVVVERKATIKLPCIANCSRRKFS